MKKFILAVLVIMLLMGLTEPGKTEKKEQAGQVGRYNIYYSPNIRADTYLLDTQTGDVWQMASDSKGEQLWQPMKKY